MELSPGVDLAWSLAGRETIAARMKEVEPDHFFCALLKFSELGAGELTNVAADPLVVPALTAERDRIKALLTQRGLASARLRHDVRRLMEHGDQAPEGGVLHRSEASRRLFEQAARLARQNKTALEAPQLLQVLLDNPTPAMARVMGDARALGDVRPKASAFGPQAESPWLDRYAQDIRQPAKDGQFDIPEVCAPQVQVLSQALRSADLAPILLVCEPPLPVLAIVGCAAQELPDAQTVACVNLATLRQEAREPGAFAEQLAQLLADAAGDRSRALFFDATGQNTDDGPLLLAVLRAAPEDGPRLILAVDVDAYAAAEAGEEWEAVFRIIWLHALTEAGLPREV